MRLSRVILVALFGALVACAADVGSVEQYPGEEAEDVSNEDLTARISAKVAVTDLAKRVTRHVVRQAVPALVGPNLAAGARVIELRTMQRGGKAARLVVDATSLSTSIVSAAAFDAASSEEVFSGTAYDRLGQRAREGVVKTFASTDVRTPPRVTLTVDMCQSSKPWDKALFEWAVNQSAQLGRAFPVAIAMTGVWAGKHPAEFRQLQAWESSGKLAIEWVNHSMTHPLNCVGNACAFLTRSSVAFDREVLDLEQVLLEQGEVPSAFFRFPGLVHNQARRAELKHFGVFGLDADAWLAKGEAIHDGGVILLHGNGNEPAGIRAFLTAMQGRYAGGEAKIQFVPLRQAMR
jgi:hypothetical protein